MHESIRICSQLLKHSFFSWRIILLIAVLFLFIFGFLNPLVQIAQNEELNLAPYAYPVLMNDHIANLAIASLSLLLFSSALFRVNTFTDNRNGKFLRARVAGNVWYIVIAALFYSLLVQIISVLCISPVLEWNSTWGEGWRVMANPETYAQYPSTFAANTILITDYHADQAYVLSVIYEFCTLVLTGLILFAFNSNRVYPIGSIIGVAFLVLDMGIQNLIPLWFSKISPISLSILTIGDEMEGMIMITRADTIGFFVLVIPLLLLLIVVRTVVHGKSIA